MWTYGLLVHCKEGMLRLRVNGGQCGGLSVGPCGSWVMYA